MACVSLQAHVAVHKGLPRCCAAAPVRPKRHPPEEMAAMVSWARQPCAACLQQVRHCNM